MKRLLLALAFAGSVHAQDTLQYWQYATDPASPIAVNTAVVIKAATGTTARNYLTGLHIVNTSATVSSYVSILDGATVIWSGYAPATTVALTIVPTNVNFKTPLKGSQNTALNFKATTTGAAIVVSAQGYTGR